MGDHGALRQAGGAAGVLQHGDAQRRVLNQVGLVLAGVVEQVGEGDAAVAILHGADLALLPQLRLALFRHGAEFAERTDHQGLQPRLVEQAGHGRVEGSQIEGDEDVGAAILDLVRQHVAGIQRRVVHHGATGAEDGEEADDVLRHVGQEQPDMHARSDAHALQPGGHARDQVGQLAVADLAAHEVDGGAIGPAAYGVVQHFQDVEAGQVGIPTNASGVRAGPRCVHCARSPRSLVIGLWGRMVRPAAAVGLSEICMDDSARRSRAEVRRRRRSSPGTMLVQAGRSRQEWRPCTWTRSTHSWR
ncbi:hypothetical protein D3C76_448990 [compost metagenome]